MKTITELCLSAGTQEGNEFLCLVGTFAFLGTSSQNKQEQETQLTVLLQLAQSRPEIAEQMLHLGGLPKLAVCLCSSSTQVSCLAADVLRALVSHQQCAAASHECLNHRIPQRLDAMLRSKQHDLQMSAAHLITHLASTQQELQRALVSAVGRSLKLLERDWGSHPECRRAAMEARAALKSTVSPTASAHQPPATTWLDPFASQDLRKLLEDFLRPSGGGCTRSFR